MTAYDCAGDLPAIGGGQYRAARPDPERPAERARLYSPLMRRRCLPLAAAGMLALYLLIAIPAALRRAAFGLRAAVKTAGLPAGEVRARVFGRRYVVAVDRIRRRLPGDEPSLLSGQPLAGSGTHQETQGAMLWVRFDLLPRRALVVQAQSRPGDCWL